jgi:hypothetical protein
MKEIQPRSDASPDGVEIVAELRRRKIPHGIATFGKRDGLKRPFKILEIPKDLVVVCSDTAGDAKREPDSFI